jgi:sec-independent protein translocase protein TatB
MFDIGFPELIAIAVISLLVIGPDKLPETIRSLALWFGRFKRSFNDLRSEIEKEIGADEIKQQLHNESVLKEIDQSRQAIEQTRADVNNLISEAAIEPTPASTNPENTVQDNHDRSTNQ